ncbi:hypothetical protein JHK84_042619 [Glycine max]|uniref:Uncharacterized protein n=1 Tax=Glycine max TaxID=3847 RepID=K7MBE1_SOYBN|nr:hypothetical protein JHK87_042303 [Glycine soja]KAG4949152.1 hypothetical protein JHK86_042391 [Glycine max]KAG4956637.1 hypothetical protein JHK85_043017 [Glycine max]KAG5116506.1 hypothetical protein JHK84_042619 [Glycine max]KAH1147209.1 hypothetical protein GYH30_042398 [Glycine max]
MPLRKPSLLEGALMDVNVQGSYSSILLGVDGLQLRFDKLLFTEDDNMSNFGKLGEEGTLRNDLGESKIGRICLLLLHHCRCLCWQV